MTFSSAIKSKFVRVDSNYTLACVARRSGQSRREKRAAKPNSFSRLRDSDQNAELRRLIIRTRYISSAFAGQKGDESFALYTTISDLPSLTVLP